MPKVEMSELATMPERPRIAWICNSAIQTSETFLVDNLELLETFADVAAFSGNPTKKNKHPSIHHLSWDLLPQKWHHIIGKKITGTDLHLAQKRRILSRQLNNAITEFNPDLFWIEFGTTAFLAKDFLKAKKTPYIIAVHGFDITREFKNEEYRHDFLLLANQSRAVVCASNHTRHLCITAGVESKKCKVIRLPLNSQRFHRINQPEPHPASFVHLGRLVEKKGPVQTLLAFAKVANTIPNAKLTIIGEGPLKGLIQDRINSLKLNHSVHMTGALSQNEALKLVREHAIFCQHSVTGRDGDQEGFALSPAEAALMEMPVISTLHNGIPEHVIHETTGLLVREWDIDGMAAAMLKLATNRTMQKAMGAAGRLNVLKLCNPESRRSQLIQLMPSNSIGE